MTPTGSEDLQRRRARGQTSRRRAIAEIRSASARISIALAIRSSGSSTGSSNAVAWHHATTSWQRTTLLSFNSPQSGYGFALMSPRPNSEVVSDANGHKVYALSASTVFGSPRSTQTVKDPAQVCARLACRFSTHLQLDRVRIARSAAFRT
jgi:hypothetical protein